MLLVRSVAGQGKRLNKEMKLVYTLPAEHGQRQRKRNARLLMSVSACPMLFWCF